MAGRRLSEHRKEVTAEIVCLMCGRDAGVAIAEQHPPDGPILFKLPDAQNAKLVRAWWRIRCAVCGGNTAAGELTIRIRRVEEAIDWRAERPHRGRPPTWLVKLRQAAIDDQH